MSSCVTYKERNHLALIYPLAIFFSFGKGLYFADIMTLSSNYCRVTSSAPEGLMLLCDTALGKQYECPRDQYMGMTCACVHLMCACVRFACVHVCVSLI